MIEIYTDGACEPNPGLGGWGFVAYQDGVEVFTDCGGAHDTTNNRMEFAGILNALQWLGREHGVIHTDSRYCLDSLTIWHKKWALNGWRKGPKKNAEPVKNADIIQMCLQARHGGHHLKWVKGHAGIVGNERADRLAALGRTKMKNQGLIVIPVSVENAPQVLVSTADEIRVITTSSPVHHCGCNVQPWEDCEHSDALAESAMREMLGNDYEVEQLPLV